ncbi:MAG: flagellar hook-length control protein FliK, partial [Peptococcaceae bacterium]|nr:flagellar hook-length control protein FliK [Peptococcaceae bacterium]
SNPSQNLPDFLPLPLKSPLFAESGFYIKNDRENSTGPEEDAHAGIFIRLRTENLGILWISLAAGNEALTLSFFTETEACTEALKDTFPVLSEGLQKLGYTSVNLAGITRPGIRSCSDIATGGNNPAIHILNLEV